MSTIEELSLKFKSANGVPVQRATFTAGEWSSVLAERANLLEANSELHGDYLVLVQEVEQLRARVEEMQHAIIYVKPKDGGKVERSSIAKIKAAAVREALLALAAECDFKSGAIASVTGSGYWKTFSDWLEEKANQIEGGA